MLAGSGPGCCTLAGPARRFRPGILRAEAGCVNGACCAWVPWFGAKPQPRCRPRGTWLSPGDSPRHPAHQLRRFWFREMFPVDGNRAWFAVDPVASRREGVVFRTFDQAPPNGILVDVPDLLEHVRGGAQVAIVSAATQPESVRRPPGWPHVCHAGEEVGAMLSDPRHHPGGHGALESPENFPHQHTRGGLQHEMDVFGHDDIGEQVERALTASIAQDFEIPMRRAMAREERLALEGGERQGVDRPVDVPALAVSSGATHAGRIPEEERADNTRPRSQGGIRAGAVVWSEAPTTMSLARNVVAASRQPTAPISP